MREGLFRPRFLLPLTVALAFVLGVALLGLPGAAHAAQPPARPEQAGGLAAAAATATAAAGASQAPSLTLTAPRALPGQTATPKPTATTSAASTTTVTLTLPTPTPAPTVTVAVTAPTAAQVVTETVDLGPVEGTILANRTDALVRFFIDGVTNDLEPQRARGLTLARPTAVLNLFNCDATLGEAQEGCFWDPYLLNRDGFYEIVAGRDAGALVSLVLREAGTPPASQVWIQNRTGRAEEVYFGTQMYEIAGTGIEEFTLEEGGEALFYLRTCIDGAEGAEPVCEWTAHKAAPGAYYGLIADEWAGSLPGTTVTSLELEPVLGSTVSTTTTSEGTPAAAATTAPAQMVCRLAVPALNVRSGPGLEFEIVAKVRSTEVEVATVTVVARTEDAQWLKVDERIATGGWAIADAQYLACDGDVNALPVVPAAELPATPTPLPVAAVPAESTAPAESVAPAEAPVDAEAAPEAEAAPAPVPAIPAGQALLTVHNGFEQAIRFTLDQRHRVEIGSSEFDLQLGQSVSIVVYPGTLQFSASSAWQGLSGNANFLIDPDSQRDLWLTFIPDPGEPGNWILVF